MDSHSTFKSSDLKRDVESQSAPSTLREKTLDVLGDCDAFIISRCGWRNVTLDSEQLRRRYELKSTTKWLMTQKSTKITRREGTGDEEVLIADWNMHLFGKDMLCWTSEFQQDYIPTKTYLRRTGWFMWRCAYQFEAHGRTYTWKPGFCSMKLYSEGQDEAIAHCHGRRYIYKPRLGYIEISATNEDLLDQLVVTWAIVQQRIHEQEAIFSLIHTILIEGLIAIFVHVLG